MDASPPIGHEHAPLGRPPAAAPKRSRRGQRMRAVLVFSMAVLIVLADAPVWFFAGWASADGDVGIPPVPGATDRVDLCGILALVAAALAAASLLVALAAALRRRQRAAPVASVLAGLSFAVGLVGFAVGLSVIQNPGV